MLDKLSAEMEWTNYTTMLYLVENFSVRYAG